MSSWDDLDLEEPPLEGDGSVRSGLRQLAHAPAYSPRSAAAAQPVRIEREPKKPFSVTELNQHASTALDQKLGVVSVEGEVSGFAPHTSGHWYFTLKDEQSQISAVCWKGSQRQVDFMPRNGDKVTARGRLAIYSVRGSYQLTISELRRAGEGTLQQRFFALQQRLQSEGLFAPEKKRALPTFPRRIAVITSADGAAVRDFLKVAVERNPGLDALIIATTVQGPGSAEKVAAAIRFVSREHQRLGLSLLVLTRGGGSLEDLWTFNEEAVVRALSACAVPTVSAIGHEVDVTLCDHAADLRAATPTDAARRVVPDMRAVTKLLGDTRERLRRAAWQRVQAERHQLTRISHRLSDPTHALMTFRQRVDQAHTRLVRALYQRHKDEQRRWQKLNQRLLAKDPKTLLASQRLRLEQVRRRLHQAVQAQQQERARRFFVAVSQLNALSPLAVLNRGYSLTTRQDTGRIVHTSADVEPGTHVRIALSRGAISAVVNKVLSEEESKHG